MLWREERTADASTIYGVVKPDLVIVDIFDDGSVVLLVEKDGKRETQLIRKPN